jgi:hypothetical protein
MVVTACLCWYDEEPHMLAGAVLSLAGVADRLVALDGRWHGFPGDQAISADEQRDAIEQTAAAIGLEGVIVRPGAAWPSQVVKRNAAFEIALAPAETDWLLVLDADEHVFSHDRQLLERLLASASGDVAELLLTNFTTRWPLDQMRANTYSVRRLFRAAAQPRYERAHNGVRTAGGSWLSGDRAHVELVDAFDVSPALTFGHSVDVRPADRHRARSVYYRRRTAEHLEDWAAA